MLTCLAMALSIVSLGDIPALAGELEADARSLSVQAEASPAFLAELRQFSAQSLQLSDALRAAGLSDDLPCIFRGIGEDAAARAVELESARLSAGAQADALAEVTALLNDAAALAPLARAAALEPAP